MCKQNVFCCDVFWTEFGNLREVVDLDTPFKEATGSAGPKTRIQYCQSKTHKPTEFCPDVINGSKMPNMHRLYQDPHGRPTCNIELIQIFKICDRCRFKWDELEKADMYSRYDPFVEPAQGTQQFYNHWTARRFQGRKTSQPSRMQVVPQNVSMAMPMPMPMQRIGSDTHRGQPRQSTSQSSNGFSTIRVMQGIGFNPNILPPPIPLQNGSQSIPAGSRQQIPGQQPPQRLAMLPLNAASIPTQSVPASPTPSGKWNPAARYQVQDSSQLITPPSVGTMSPMPCTSQACTPVSTSRGYFQQHPQIASQLRAGSPVLLDQTPTPPKEVCPQEPMYTNGNQHPSQEASALAMHENRYQWAVMGNNGGSMHGMVRQQSFNQTQALYQQQTMIPVAPVVSNEAQQVWQNGNGRKDFRSSMTPSSNLGYYPSYMAPNHGVAISESLSLPGQEQSIPSFTPQGSLERKANDSLYESSPNQRGSY